MSELETAPLAVLGRIMPASNQTWFCALGGPDSVGRVVYKPVAGERPLWDFPNAVLAGREYAAWLVSEALGWDVVPRTVLRDGPYGPGMVQEWVDVDESVDPVAVVRAPDRPEGYLHVLDAEDDRGRAVELVHEDSAGLLRIAVFDLLVNNTDRKAGHLLALPDGRRQGVDHGICFHVDNKLRTVLWGFHGRPVPGHLLEAIGEVVGDTALADELGFHLSADEVAAFTRRCVRVLREPRMPELAPGWPSIPWPPF